MRVKIFDLEGAHVIPWDAGQRLLALIEPVLARGEPVVLDFEGVRDADTHYFNDSVGQLIEKDTENRLPGLLSYENLSPIQRLTLDDVVEFRVRRRENPRWARAMEQVAQQFSERGE